MSINVIRATAAAAVIMPTLVVLGAGPAAASSATVVGGRERVKITLASTLPCDATYQVDVNGSTAAAYQLKQGGSTTFTLRAPSGNPWIKVLLYCSEYEELAFDAVVAVNPANPLLDALDRALQSAGSSTLVTDPTLR